MAEGIWKMADGMTDISKLKKDKSFIIYEPPNTSYSRFDNTNKEFVRINHIMMAALTSNENEVGESTLNLIGRDFEVCTIILHMYVKEEEGKEETSYVIGVIGPEEARKQTKKDILKAIRIINNENPDQEDNYKHIHMSVTDPYLQSKMRKLKK